MTRRLVSYVAVASLLAVAIPLSAHAATTAAKSTEQHSSTHHSGKSTATPKIDLNKASESQLMTLPGVDEAAAQKIVSMRPYKNANQVVSKGILTKEQFATIEHHVTATQPKSEKSEAKSAEKPASKDAMKSAGSTEGSTTK